ncbi:MAG: hypothetical protein LBV69_05270, partial [Bacteroidales bacterium]|nr:hypothetical protein [Bacteroidales bacterium]
AELLLHFDIVSIKESGDASQAQGVLHILLEEKNILPSGYYATDYESKGFYESSEIQDFPIRGKKVLLKLRRHPVGETKQQKAKKYVCPVFCEIVFISAIIGTSKTYIPSC